MTSIIATPADPAGSSADTRQDFCASFRAAVALAPDEIAVASERGRLTYRELDEWSDDLAAAWHAQLGAGPEPVAIVAGHDEWFLAAFVALAKASRPSVVLDTTTPVERMRTILGVATPAAVVCAPELRALAEQVGEGIAAEALEIAPRGEYGGRPALPEPAEDQVLTVVFTSGSTGRPKGVVIGSVPFMDFARTNYVLGSDRPRIVACVPMSFVAGMWIVGRAVATAGSIHLCDPRRQGLDALAAWIRDSAATAVSLTPYMMRTLAKLAREQGIRFDTVRVVSVGGEPVLATDVHAIRAVVSPACVIYPGFGSSECWVPVCMTLTAADPVPPEGRLPLGAAYVDREVWLLDEDGNRITEPDRTGVIHGVARTMSWGYWNDPEKTAERFSTLPDGRVRYNFGDLGRWDSDGNLVFAGRIDAMVKIRGYLVEPAEVEAHLRSGDEIADCVVVGVADPDGVQRLVAYVVPEPTTWLSAAGVRRRLSTELPGYMVPRQFVELTALPLNPNGKVDRLALPRPEQVVASEPPAGYWEASNGWRRAISDVCAAALGLEYIGPDDDLFELGADSLAVEEIAAGLEPILGRPVSSSLLMAHPTAAGLATLRRTTRDTLVDGVLVPLVDGTAEAGDDRPIFLIAGGGGLAVALRDLAVRISHGRPVYGLQGHGLETEGLPDLTLKRVARRYARAIRRVQADGPYRLLGHSLGGLVMHELARQLLAAGQEVDFLGLLDPPDLASGSVVELRNITPVDPAARPQPVAAEAGAGLIGSGRARLRELQDRLYHSHPELTRRQWRQVRAGGRFALHLEIARLMVARHHQPRRPLSGVRAVIYQAEGSVLGMTRGYFATTPQIVPVEGDHLTMLRRPYVDVLAEQISRELLAG